MQPFNTLRRPKRKDGKRHFSRACSDRARGNGFRLKEGRLRLKEEILYHEGGEALEKVAQRGCVQGHVGQGFEQPGLVKGVPAHGRGVGNRQSIRSLPIQTIL